MNDDGATVSSPPAHGRVHLRLDGTFDYVPDPDYAGEDHFEYVALDDESRSEPTRVELSISPVNDAPLARADRLETRESQEAVRTGRR